MAGHDIVVIGASAGGVEALKQLARELPGDLPASVFVVLHVPQDSVSFLPSILNRAGSLPASAARDGEVIEPRRIYVAPPSHHLLVKRGHVRVTRGAAEHGHRPAVDPLFRTAARAYGPRVVGVILSGTLDDGTAGLAEIHERGGVAIVQSPEDALYKGMPLSALEVVDADYCLRATDIAATISRLAHESVTEEGTSMAGDGTLEPDSAELEIPTSMERRRRGGASGFGCPMCGGMIWEKHDGRVIQFQCRVGHRFSSKSLLAEQNTRLEQALWTALNALEEKAELTGRLGTRNRERGHELIAGRFERQSVEARHAAEVLAQVLESAATNSLGEVDPGDVSEERAAGE